MRWLFYFAAVVFVACSPEKQPSDKTQIVCTTGMIGDAISQMVDSNCTVSVLMGPGTDPHLYKPTKASLDLLSGADIVIANGLHLEGKMQDILEKMSMKKPIFFLAETLPTEKLILSDSSARIYDPHIWFDVELWRESLSLLAPELKRQSVLDSISFRDYNAQLLELDRWVREELGELDPDSRILITAHDAFSYFGEAYDFEVKGLQGISTVSEYGLRDVTNLVDTIVERRVPAVFIESSISPRAIEAVVQGTKQKGFETSLGGTLYSDALGGESSGADTYVKMVRHNVSTIKESLK